MGRRVNKGLREKKVESRGDCPRIPLGSQDNGGVGYLMGQS